jgi:hypothetical protein
MKKATTMAFPVMITSIGLGGPYAIHAALPSSPPSSSRISPAKQRGWNSET